MMTSGKIIMEKQTQLINFNSSGIVEMGTILAATQQPVQSQDAWYVPV